MYDVDRQDDNRVIIPRLEIYPVTGCNLRCQHCAILSPWRKGWVTTEKIVNQSEVWRKKLHPATFAILGGEPFLHPDIATIITESYRIWNDSALEIVSNGLLLPQTPQCVYDALKKTKAWVIISDHSGMDLAHEKVVVACACLNEKGIPYELRPSNTHWRIQHQYDENGIPLPFQSDPHDAWSRCIVKHNHTLANNKLYKCSILASIIEGIEEGAISPVFWNDVRTYCALTPDADATSILEHLDANTNGCSVCPDKITVIEAKQMEKGQYHAI